MRAGPPGGFESNRLPFMCVFVRVGLGARSVTIWENSCWVNSLIIRIFVPLALSPVVVHALAFFVIVPIPFVYYRMTFMTTLGAFYAFLE